MCCPRGQLTNPPIPLPTDGPVGGRGRSFMAVLDLASRGVRSSAVRTPRTVHNEGKGGSAGMLTEIARRTGESGCAHTREALGWEPTHPSLLEDLENIEP